ncbi:MAG: translation elongation factor Ts [Deltaproteobacteria bacterium CG2_30_63_29]|nr:MAG: translation elongation factor Ts [Deltaproteobacteria bacterium CG2_30_63_29]PJB36352.1 MAG: translation elongation factor Ts [Deltaproteobacteria bacterium CG_4_9_14_3_um_filter_63_12]
MAEISAGLVKDLRTRTGAGMMDCKKALVENEGDIDKAIEYLQIKGLSKAAKRADREATEGFIGSYIHHDGKTGVMVEINCETDFVGRNEDFRAFAKHIAMHIAAAKPDFVQQSEVSEDVVAQQRHIFEEQAKESGKPAAIAVKMAEGRMAKWLKEICLLDQPFVMDPNKTIEQKRVEISSTCGENVVIKRFQRFVIGPQA